MKLILACDTKGGIGYQNKLPWPRLDGDLKRFKTLTYGKVVVMGRKTWESLPTKPLRTRLNFVVTSNTSLELPNGAMAIPNLNHFTDFADAWLIGGAALVNSSWDLITEVHLSRTFVEHTCDTFIDLAHLENNYIKRITKTYSDHTYEVWSKKCSNT
jgi:dihydrofolate reductase